MFSEQDTIYMQRALALAWQGRFSTSPNPRVGCVIARGGQIIGEGFHIQAGGPHAEVHALRQAGGLARGATAYVSLEPCAHHGRTPPCAQALIDAGIGRVVAAMRDPNPLVAGKGLTMLNNAGIETASGLCEAQARQLNRGFLSRIERGRPFVKLKTAFSLDGKTALSDGRSQWITGKEARADVQIVRAESCGILTGIDTVLHDNPQLNVRDFPTLRQPVRIVADSRFRLPEHSRLIQDGQPVWIMTCKADSQRFAAYPHVRVFRVAADEHGRIRLPEMLAVLAREGIGELMVEAGATLQSALLQQQLVDEIICYQSPKLLGGNARNAFTLPENPVALQSEPQWQTQKVDILGQDIKWVLAIA